MVNDNKEQSSSSVPRPSPVTVTPKIDFIDLTSIEVKEVEFLVQDFLPSGLISLLYADGGSGKSYLALYLAALIASGKPFLNKTTKQGRVLYLDFEVGPDLQALRLNNIANGLGIDKDILSNNLSYLRPGTQKDVAAKLDKLIPVIKEEAFDLYIIDSLGMALTADPESAKDICSFFQELVQLGTVLLIDHQPKPQKGDKARDKTPFGSAYKFNLSRNIWHLNSKKDDEGLNCLLRHTKSNFSALQDNLGLKLRFDKDKFTVEECQPGAEFSDFLNTKELILNAYAELGEATAQAIAEEIGEDIKKIKPRISELKRQGKLKETGKKEGQRDILTLTTNETSKEVRSMGGSKNKNCNTGQAKETIIKEFDAKELPF